MPTNIDLTPNQDTDTGHVLGYFFSWLSKSGKYVLLGANTLLFLLYIYRFNIDRQNILLSRDIARLNENITRNENLALEYKEVQKIVEYVENENKSAVDPEFILVMLSGVTPTGVEIKRLDVDSGTINITAQSFDPVTFSSFIEYFLTDSNYSGIILTSSLYSESDDSFTFNLRISMANEV